MDWSQALQMLSDRLESVAAQLPVGRRPAPEEVARLLRERCDLTVVLGGLHPAESDHIPYPMPGTATQLADALLIDQRSPGRVSWLSEAISDRPTRFVCFLISMAMGNGSPTPQPTVTFALDLEDNEVARFCLTKSPRQWMSPVAAFMFLPLNVQSTPFGQSFAVDQEIADESTLTDGYGFLLVERDAVATGRANRLAVRALSENPARTWCRIGLTPQYYPAFLAENHWDSLRWAFTPRRHVAFGEYRLALGDLHAHSGESDFLGSLPEGVGADEACGVGDRASLFDYARDVAGLDFFSLSEHDWQMSTTDWASLLRLNDAYLSDAFVTIHGYEWTSQLYGHRNVYFGERPGSLFWSQDARNPYEFLLDSPSPRDLWDHIRREGLPAITIPHHMSAAQFPLDLRDFFDAELDRLVEIYSCWGDSLEDGQPVTTGASRVARLEFIRAVREGFATGFIASSDSHDAHPGNAQGTAARPQLAHHLGSGRAGVFVRELSRADIFSGLQARRSFAGTGEGLAVWTTFNGDPMGSSTTRDHSGGTVELAIRSDLPLASVHVYRNGHRSESVDVRGERGVDTSWTERAVANETTRSLFVKVTREDGEMAWTSPHWIGD